MEWTPVVDVLVGTFAWAIVALLAYGAHLVVGNGGFHRDAPEDAALPHLDLSHEL